MKPTLIKIDAGLWINPELVLLIGASNIEGKVNIAFDNGSNITIEKIQGTPQDTADMIAAMVNGEGH